MANPTTHAEFAEGSFSWQYIERPALDSAIDDSMYTDATVLDLGCGAGRVINYHLSRGADEARVIGVDADRNSIDIASYKFPLSDLIVAPMQNYQIQEGKFDLVTAIFSLRYLDPSQLSKTFKSIHAGLKQGGQFIFLDVHPLRQANSDDGEFTFAEGPREVSTPWGKREPYYFKTLATYINTAIESGFRIVKLDECEILPEAKEASPEDFAKYSPSAGPARFLVKAVLA